jgi:4-hydroxy-tetrahydrodipicolinate reductase
MTANVIVNGATGRMGHITAATITETPEFNLVATLSSQDNLAQAIVDTRADSVIDFTNADVVFANAQTIIQAGAHPVIGTSGLLPAQVAELRQQCAAQKLGGIIAPNFSIGAVLMMKYAADAARYLPDVEIIELHHPGKLDSPSGTALKTAEMIVAHRKAHDTPPAGKETVPGARGAAHEQVHIHAVRLPGLVAHQSVIFGGVGETLTIRHDSLNRECFMPGVLLACRQVCELDELIYGLENLLTPS